MSIADRTQTRANARGGKLLVSALGLALGATIFQPAIADPMLVGSASEATGITGLVVDGQAYNVSFVFDTYDDVFASTPPLFGSDESTAADAINALAGALNALDVTALAPNTEDGAYSIVIPDSAVVDDQFYGQQAVLNILGPTWADFPSAEDSNSQIGADGTYGHNFMAVFSDDNVPEPTSLALLGSALAGLGLARRRKRKAAR